MTPTLSYNQSDVRENAIFTTPEGVRCRVDNLDDSVIHMTVLDGRKINGQSQLEMTFAEVQNAKWKLSASAAA